MPIQQFTNLYNDAANQYGIDPQLLMAQGQVESGGDPKAYNEETGASGLAQLIPTTAKALGVTDPTDPKQAIPAQAKLMAENLKRYKDPELALMAYHGGTDQSNWGPKTQAYPGKVFANYKGTQMAQNDPLTQALLDRAAEADKEPGTAAPITGNDPLTQALLDRAAQGDTSVQTNASGSPQSPQGEATIGEKVGSGLQRGIEDVVNSKPIMSGSEWVENKIRDLGIDPTLGGKFPTVAQEEATQKNDLANYDKRYGTSPIAGTARLGGNLAAALPMMSAGGAVLGAALPEGAAADFLAGAANSDNVLVNAASRATSGAIQGGAATALTSGGSNLPLSDQVRIGAETGGALGPIVGPVAGAVKNFMTGGGPSEAVANLAQTATDKYGIPIYGPQISNSPFVHFFNSMTGKVPFSGAPAREAAQTNAFTKAVAGTFGEDADRLTPDVMSDARKRIGDRLNSIAGRTNINADDNLINGLSGIADSAQGLTETESHPILKQIDNILGSIGEDNRITGAQYQSLTRKGSPLDTILNSSNPNMRYSGKQIRGVLDDALENSAAPEDLADLKNARLQYKNLMTVKDLAAKAGVEGEINPSLLAGAVRKSYKNMAFTGAGDIGELSNIGNQFLKEPPSSGTAERLTAMKILEGLNPGRILEGIGLAGGGGLAWHNPLLGLVSVPGLIGSSRATQTALNSQAYKNMLMQKAFGQGSNALTSPGTGTIAPSILGNRFQSPP